MSYMLMLFRRNFSDIIYIFHSKCNTICTLHFCSFNTQEGQTTFGLGCYLHLARTLRNSHVLILW